MVMVVDVCLEVVVATQFVCPERSNLTGAEQQDCSDRAVDRTLVL